MTGEEPLIGETQQAVTPETSSPPPEGLALTLWEEYLGTGKPAPGVFFRRAKKEATPPLEGSSVELLAATVSNDRKKVVRLTNLFRHYPGAGVPMRASLLCLGESALRAEGSMNLPHELDPDNFFQAVRVWLMKRSKGSIAQAQLEWLMLAVAFGIQRELLEVDEVLFLLNLALAGKDSASEKKGSQDPLEVFLEAPANKAILAASLHLAKAYQESTKRIVDEHEALVQQVAQLKQLLERAGEDALRMQLAVETAETSMRLAEEKVQTLEARCTSIRNGYQHEIAGVRARIRGVLTGTLVFWLETALEAVRADPPRLSVAEQRLTSTLQKIRTENEWLGSSD